MVSILDYFKNSYVLWVYRDYKDVASSNLKKFGLVNGINNLRPIINAEPHNWRSEGVSEEEKDLVFRYFSEDMKPHDAAVLFWYLRNNLFFRLKLDENPRVIMCKYEHLIENPKTVLARIYKICDQQFPGERISKEIHSKSIKKGKDIDISPEIDLVANELLMKLDEAFYKKNPEYS